MGVNDYGTGSDKLNSPQLSAWAGSVATALNGSDVTVDARIAAKVATGAGSPEGVATGAVGALYSDTTNGLLYVKESGTGNTGWLPYAPTRITRPNTDDRLVEAWNGAAWSVVGYDSGWRDMSGSVDAAWAMNSSGGFLRMRRVMDRVMVTGRLDRVTASGLRAASSTVLALPDGFRPTAHINVPFAGAVYFGAWTGVMANVGSVNSLQVSFPPAGVTTWAAGDDLFFSADFSTGNAPPSSLPGTLYDAAPA